MWYGGKDDHEHMPLPRGRQDGSIWGAEGVKTVVKWGSRGCQQEGLRGCQEGGQDGEQEMVSRFFFIEGALVPQGRSESLLFLI